MKKKIWVIIAVALVALAAMLPGGCAITNGNGVFANTVVGNGQVVTQEREIGAQAGVINKTSFSVVIDPELTGKAVIEGESNLVELIVLSQSADGVLSVETKPNVSMSTTKRMTITVPAVNGGVIGNDGSGDVTLQSGTLAGDAFDVLLNGSGNVTLALTTGALSISINGSGNADIDATATSLVANIGGSGHVDVAGGAGPLRVTIAGSGDFNGFDYAAADADVTIMGSGNAHVNVSGKLTGGLLGSGSVVYAGTPASIDVNVTGSGGVRAR